MELIRKIKRLLFSQRSEDATFDSMSTSIEYQSTAGETVTATRALSIPALYQAVNKISGDVAKTPMGVWQRLERGGRVPTRNHHAFRFVNLVGMANKEINAFKFWRRLLTSALLFGNGYAWIDKNAKGEVLGLYNLLPDRTGPIRRNGKSFYVTEVAGRLEELPSDQVFHIEGISTNGLDGENPIKLFRELFGAALAKKKFASKFFNNRMSAGGVLTIPAGTTEDTGQKINARIREQYSGTSNAFKTLVLREGFRWYKTQVSPKRGALTKAYENDVRQIARIFNMRAVLLSTEGSRSYQDEATQDYFDGCLSHWLVACKCEANAKLRTQREREEDQVFFDYNINSLLWTDAKTRNEIAVGGIQNGWLSPNETRSWENLNPYAGGNQYYVQAHLVKVADQRSAVAFEEDEQAADEQPDEPHLTKGPEDAKLRMAYDTLEAAEEQLHEAIDAGSKIEVERASIIEMIEPACEILNMSLEEGWRLVSGCEV